MPNKEQTYQFIMVTDKEDYLSFKEDHIRFDAVILKDSIYSFFPTLTVHLPDATGLFSEKFFFLEGQKYNIKLGTSEDGYIEHPFYWSSDGLSLYDGGMFIAGKKTMGMLSYLELSNEVRSRSFKDTISNSIQSVMSNYKVKKSYITETVNNDIWYQHNIKDTEFIDNQREFAVGNNDDSSPYYAFFNLNSEFYFQNIADLMKGKSEDEFTTVTKVQDPSQRILQKEIQNIEYNVLGATVNRKNYNIDFHSIKKDATINSLLNQTIDSHIYKNGGKIPINKNLLDIVSDSIYIGIEDGYSANEIRGKINQFYIDSNLNFRLQVVLSFNKKLVSGKVITIKVGSIDDGGKTYAQEFSDNWLISQSSHQYNNKQIAMTELELIKPYVKINKDNLYLSEFVA